MIPLDIRSRSRTKNPTPTVVRNPTPTPPKTFRLLTTPTPWLMAELLVNLETWQGSIFEWGCRVLYDQHNVTIHASVCRRILFLPWSRRAPGHYPLLSKQYHRVASTERNATLWGDGVLVAISSQTKHKVAFCTRH